LRLGDVCLKIGSGATPRGGKDVYLPAGGVATLIRSQNIYNEGFERSGLVSLLPEHAAQLQNVKVESGDVLLNITGDSVARACQVPIDVLPARVNQHVAIIRPDPAKLHARFLRFLLVSPAMQAHMLALASAGATRNALTKGMIEALVLPALSLKDQQRIADLLGALEDKLDLNRRTNGTLEATARAVFKDWFVDFGPTRAQAEGRIPYLISELWRLFPRALDCEGKPNGWQRRPLYDIAEFTNGAAYKDMDFSPGREGLPVIKIAELKSGVTSTTRFTAKHLGERYRIEQQEILFSWSGNPDTSIDTFIWAGGPAWLNQHIFRVRENGKAKRAMIYFQLKELKPVFAEIARNKQTTGLGHVTTADMKRLLVGEPPSEVTNAFEGFGAPILEKLFSNLLENHTLSRLRDLLLPGLISGEVHLKDAENKAKEAL
jgi:type I restriction enzyme, S subunit